MKLTKIFAENLKTFPKLELYLEDYNLALVTGPNGAGKTTAFVTIPVIAFYNEFNGRSLKDYALENRVAKIGLEFEHEGKRYIIVRQYSEGSVQSIFTDVLEKRKISKSREIERAIERLFGMDAKTFMNTVVIAQGEVETLSERTPKERRELFLKFLGIDFRKAYEKAGDEIKNLDTRINEIRTRKEMLKGEVKEKPEVAGRIPKVEEEVERLNSNLNAEESEKKRLLIEKEGLQKQLDGIKESMAGLQILKGEKERLEKEIKEFEKQVRGLKKEDIAARIEDLNQKLNTASLTLSLLEKKNLVEAKAKSLEEIVKTFEKYRRPEEIKKDEEELKRRVNELEEKVEAYKRLKMELDTKAGASKLYVKKLQEETRCPLCKSELTEERRVELIKEIEHEIVNVPSKVEEINAEIKRLSDEISSLKRKIEEKVREHGMSCDAYRKVEDLSRELSPDILQNPREELKRLRSELDGIARSLEENGSKIGLDPGSLRIQRILEVQKEIGRDRDELNRALSAYEKYEQNLSALNSIVSQIEKLSPLEDEKRRLEGEIGRIENLIRQKDADIGKLNRVIGEKERQLQELKEKLKELEDKERQLKSAEEEEKELLKRKEVFTIIKEQVFKDNAFPTVFLSEFVKHVQINLSDFISRFKGGRYEIDIAVTEEGDVEIRARDRSKIDSSFRPIRDFSQGERTILGFAIRLATMKAISSYKEKSMPNILIVDEGFGPLDQENMKALIDGIKELVQVFEQIFIITHIEQVKEEFEQRLVVEETPKGSIVKRV